MKSTPILLASAHRRDTESIVQGLKSGANDYLEVPFDATRLIAKVSRLLERSRVEANYRDLVEQANDLIFTVDIDRRLSSINVSGAQFLSARQSELIGSFFADAFNLNVSNELLADMLKQFEETGEPPLVLEARDHNGRERWLEIGSSPIKNRLGETIGLRGVARDITDRKHMGFGSGFRRAVTACCLTPHPNPFWYTTKIR